MIPLQQSFQKDILSKVTFLSDFHVVLHWLLDDSIGFMIPSPPSPLPSPREQWFIVVWILSTQSCSNQNSLRKTWPGFFSQIQTSSFYKNKQVLFIFTNMFLLKTFDVSYVPPVQFPIQNEDVGKCIKACNVAHVWLLPSLINLIQLNPTFMPMSTNATRESEGSTRLSEATERWNQRSVFRWKAEKIWMWDVRLNQILRRNLSFQLQTFSLKGELASCCSSHEKEKHFKTQIILFAKMWNTKVQNMRKVSSPWIFFSPMELSNSFLLV